MRHCYSAVLLTELEQLVEVFVDKRLLILLVDRLVQLTQRLLALVVGSSDRQLFVYQWL